MSWKFSFILFIIVIAVIAGCNKKNQEPEKNEKETLQDTKIKEDEHIAPDFSLFTPDGEKVTLSDYSGKIILLDFWATWCPPCIKSIPDLISIQNKYKGDLVVIGISMDHPSLNNDNLLQFIKKHSIDYSVVVGTQKVASDYGDIQAIPTLFIIDREGRIINEHIGLVPISTLEKEITAALKKS